MPEDKLLKLYTNLKAKKIYKLPDSYEQFRTDMSDESKLNSLYTNLKSKNKYNLPDYETFKTDMFPNGKQEVKVQTKSKVGDVGVIEEEPKVTNGTLPLTDKFPSDVYLPKTPKIPQIIPEIPETPITNINNFIQQKEQEVQQSYQPVSTETPVSKFGAAEKQIKGGTLVSEDFVPLTQGEEDYISGGVRPDVVVSPKEEKSLEPPKGYWVNKGDKYEQKIKDFEQLAGQINKIAENPGVKNIFELQKSIETLEQTDPDSEELKHLKVTYDLRLSGPSGQDAIMVQELSGRAKTLQDGLKKDYQELIATKELLKAYGDIDFRVPTQEQMEAAESYFPVFSEVDLLVNRFSKGLFDMAGGIYEFAGNLSPVGKDLFGYLAEEHKRGGEYLGGIQARKSEAAILGQHSYGAE